MNLLYLDRQLLSLFWYFFYFWLLLVVWSFIQSSLLQQTLACSILTALLSEFSSSSKTSSIGLSMEFHGNCKRLFQVRYFFSLYSPVSVFISLSNCSHKVVHSSLFSPSGGRPASNLYDDDGGAAGVQSTGEPQRSNVLCLSTLPGTGQPGPQLELPATQSYPFFFFVFK